VLKSLTLDNFRGFSEHRIEFGPETILIGQNNAGKTTAIEALRVLSVCQTRAKTASLGNCPTWLDGQCTGAGFKVSLETIDFDFTNVQHSYNRDRPAIIRAKNSNHSEVHIYIGQSPDEIFCQLKLSQNKTVHQRSDMISKSFGKTKVMPPIGSLLAHERSIAKDRLNRYIDGYLAYRHFRNQLWERPADYRLFRDLIEGTWPGLKIQHFENDHGETRNEFSLLVREGRFTSEISWHGHGLQAWMQTMWFLARVDKSSTVVLDEPDVYLHADLQRKLIKVIEGLDFPQSIIATHSPEIIGDVPFQNVTVVQKRERASRPSGNATEIQNALKGMGSLHSIQLAKIAQTGLIFFVEGDDRPFLTDVAYKMGSRFFDGFSRIAIQEIKGKGNWQYAIGASKSLCAASNGEISTVLLLDRDFMLDQERDHFYKRSSDEGLILKIWNKKEIENYFICPKIVARYISKYIEGHVDPAVVQIALDEIEKEIAEDVILSFADVLQKATTPRIEPKTAFRRAKALVDDRVASGERLTDIACGKDVISKLSKFAQDKFGVSFSPLSLCKEMRESEIPEELKELVRGVCDPSTISVTSFCHA
jgi:hypothetical protein